MNQLRTILWLRSRLSRNQLRRHGTLGAIIAALIAVGAVGLGLLTFGAAFLVGSLVLRDVPPTVVQLVWLILSGVFLLFWLVGMLTELQRSESIDLERLMHLPVALGQIFLVNYAASHFTLSIVIAVPAMIGLALGLTVSRGPQFLLALPLILAAVGLVTAWTYCLRGWLATLMTNPRRRRTVVMLLTLVVVGSFQLPNFYFNFYRRMNDIEAVTKAPTVSPSARQSKSAEPKPRRRRKETPLPPPTDELWAGMRLAESAFPPLWLAAGAGGLAEGEVTPALLGTLGGFLIAAWGLLRAYRSTVRFYRGVGDGRSAAPRAAALPSPAAPAHAERGRPGTRWMEARVPGLSEQASAVAVASLRSMTRAPELKLLIGAALIITLLFCGTAIWRAQTLLPPAFKPFAVTGMICFSCFVLVNFLTNQYGMDRDAFRVLVLSPIPRRQIVLGKAVASLSIAATMGVILLIASAVGLHLGPVAILAAAFEWLTMLLAMGLTGSAMSILFPLRIAAGSLKPTKTTGVNMVMVVLCQMCFPLVALPAFLPSLAQLLWDSLGLPERAPVSLVLAVLITGLLGMIYWAALTPLGRLFQRREQRMLEAVTTAME